MADDIIAQVLAWWHDDRSRTHSVSCWQWHPECAIATLGAEVQHCQAEIERLRNLLDAVVEEFNPSCHCDHYPRHDCPCARVRRMLDGLGLPSTNHPEEARRG